VNSLRPKSLYGQTSESEAGLHSPPQPLS
jgi:hypothetical protein